MTGIPVLATLDDTTDLPEEECLGLFVQQQQAIIGLLAEQNQSFIRETGKKERLYRLDQAMMLGECGLVTEGN